MLERGHRQPTLETLFKIAKDLGLAPAGLVARTSSELKSRATGVSRSISRNIFPDFWGRGVRFRRYDQVLSGELQINKPMLWLLIARDCQHFIQPIDVRTQN